MAVGSSEPCLVSLSRPAGLKDGGDKLRRGGHGKTDRGLKLRERKM